MNQRPRPSGRRRSLPAPNRPARPAPVQAPPVSPSGGADSFEALESAVLERQRTASEQATPPLLRRPGRRRGSQAALARRALGSPEDLRRAIVLREIIGPPAALRPSPTDALLSDQMGS